MGLFFNDGFSLEAHQEVEREYCWYIKLGDELTLILSELMDDFKPLYQRQANVKAPNGAIRVRAEKDSEGITKYTQTIKEFQDKVDGLATSKETTLEVDEDFYIAFSKMVGKEMCKVRFLIPDSDNHDDVWEVDIFTDGDFKPLPYAKVDLETKRTLDEDTINLPIRGDAYPASPTNKAIVDEINDRVQVNVSK